MELTRLVPTTYVHSDSGMTLNPTPIVEPASHHRKLLLICGCFLACHQSVAPAGSTPERCGPAVPASAQHPITARAIGLAGDYQLIQVQTQPRAGETSVGRLHLTP